MIYNFIAVAPCQLLIKGERKNLRGGDTFTTEDSGVAAQIQDYNHPQYQHLRLLSTEGTLEEVSQEPSRGEQILQMISGQADAEVMVEPITTNPVALEPEPELTNEEAQEPEPISASTKRRRKAVDD